MRQVVVLGVVLGTVVIGGVLITARARERVLEQPIAFSHKTHAAENHIPCLYCHANARRSPVAGIPSVHLCMGCHKITAADEPEVEKLREIWEQQKPIAWAKVFDQPDFVRFSHKRHVVKDITCQTCHGPIETMERVREAVLLNMKRCVDCHLAKQATIDCLVCHK